jgi:hypothetical protein
VKVKTQGGGERPDNASHFVVHDAPNVEEVYGPAPTELDVVFPSDDLDACVPTWFMWWRPGAKDKNGKPISGVLRCKGNGPSEDGQPGTAQFFDKRDPTTGIVPSRPCLAQSCSDWKDAKGNPQCKPNMKIYVYLPKVSPYGVYQISTTSWTTIKAIYDQLKWIQQRNDGKISGIPFKLVKEQKSFTKFDANGREQKVAQWVVLIKPIQDQKALEGMSKSIQLLESPKVKWQAPPQLLEAPIADVPHLDVAVADAEVKVSAAEALLGDQEVQAYFKRLEQVLGGELSPKDRLIKARKCEGKPDPKKALLEMIAKEGKDLAAKAAKAAPPPAAAVVDQPPPASESPAPVEASGGLI